MEGLLGHGAANMNHERGEIAQYIVQQVMQRLQVPEGAAGAATRRPPHQNRGIDRRQPGAKHAE